MNLSDAVNSLYHGAVVGGVTTLYTMVLKKTLKVQPADLDKFKIEDSLKEGILPASVIVPSPKV